MYGRIYSGKGRGKSHARSQTMGGETAGRVIDRSRRRIHNKGKQPTMGPCDLLYVDNGPGRVKLLSSAHRPGHLGEATVPPLSNCWLPPQPQPADWLAMPARLTTPPRRRQAWATKAHPPVAPRGRGPLRQAAWHPRRPAAALRGGSGEPFISWGRSGARDTEAVPNRRRTTRRLGNVDCAPSGAATPPRYRVLTATSSEPPARALARSTVEPRTEGLEGLGDAYFYSTAPRREAYCRTPRPLSRRRQSGRNKRLRRGGRRQALRPKAQPETPVSCVYPHGERRAGWRGRRTHCWCLRRPDWVREWPSQQTANHRPAWRAVQTPADEPGPS